MRQQTSKNAILPGFTAQNSLINNYQVYAFFGIGRSDSTNLLMPAAVCSDPVCLQRCVDGCPQSGPQRAVCVKGCNKECCGQCGPCQWAFSTPCPPSGPGPCGCYKNCPSGWMPCNVGECSGQPCPPGHCDCYGSHNCAGVIDSGRCYCIQ
jgi:hypothetical protein